MQHKTNWNKRFLELAHLVASWSKDPSRKVGCVITRGKRIVSVGYNGFPAGVEDRADRYIDRDTKLKFIQHAERNALDNTSEDLTGCTLYSTLYPCNECAKSIIGRGIYTVVYDQPLSVRSGGFNPDTAAIMFAEAGVEVIPYEHGDVEAIGVEAAHVCACWQGDCPWGILKYKE